MRKPPIAPGWFGFFSELDDEEKVAWLTLSQTEKVANLVRQANDRYVHWHKFRYYTMPDNVTPEEGWAAVQFHRHTQRQPLDLAFEHLDKRLQYWNPPQHLAWLHKIDQEAGGVIGGARDAISHDEDRYLFSSLMEEAIASSQIEGAQTTRSTAKDMLRTQRKPHDKSEQMILNNYTAILQIREMLKKKLTPEVLCHLHTILTQDTLDNSAKAGQVRTDDDNVRVEDAGTFEVLHQPPRAGSLNVRIEEICDFANEHSKPFIHPVVKAIILHFAIAFVHPFVDGNGRTARAVFYWYMLKHGYWLFEFLSISRIVVAAPAKYGRAFLYTELDAGDVTYFIHYHLGVILRAMKELHEYLLGQRRKLREATSLIQACPGLNHRQSTLLRDALKHPDNTYSITQHKGIHRVAYGTARSDLLELESFGFFDKILDGRRLLFFPVGDLMRRLKKSQ